MDFNVQASECSGGANPVTYPFRLIWEGLKRGWDILRTVYWYNSIPWRVLKSGALVVFGFFFLAGANLLHSYKPDWDFLYLLMSYGFLMIVYGPIHHLIIIPVSLRLNHYSWGRAIKVGKRVPFWTLMAFCVAVVVFGFYPLDVMTFEFKATAVNLSHDINPELSCVLRTVEEERIIRCELSPPEGIHSITVENAGRTIVTDEEPPFAFSFPEAKLEKVVGRKNFQVVLRDQYGEMIRRYVRSVSMLDVDTMTPSGTSTG